MSKRSKVILSLLAAVLVPAVLVFSFEDAIEHRYVETNSHDPALWKMVAYNQPVHRIPNSTLRFRLYGLQAEELARADVRLNNIGLFSSQDYYKEKSRKEFRIVVLGGEQAASSVADQSWPDFLEKILRQRFPDRDIRVLNFAWPDAGPEHYISYWKEEASQFHPDLVIVNLVESDFYRTITGAVLSFQGRPLEHGREISYAVNGAMGKHYVSVVRGLTGEVSLSNPSVIAPRPYGFFLEEPFFEDRSMVKAVQETLVEKQIQGALEMLRPLWSEYIWKSGNLPSVASLRNFDPPKQDAVSREALVQFGARTFGWIVRNIPHVVLLHNFNYAEMARQFELTESLMKADLQIVVHDMRKRIPVGTSDGELQSWFLYPHMTEKWSLKGHAAYANLVSEFLVEQNLITERTPPKTKL